LAQAPVLFSGKTSNIDAWLAEVVTSQPADVDTLAWRRTCAIRALAAGCEIDLGQRLIAILLDDVDAQAIPPEQKLAFYQEAFTLLNARQNWDVAKASWERYFKLGEQAFREHNLRPFSFVRNAMITSPVSWRHRFELANPDIIRLELVQLLYESRWEEALEFCQQLRYYRPDNKSPLLLWAEAIAVRQAPNRASADISLSRLAASWRPLLVEELSKDTYNALAEMQAVLDSDAFDDAARMISSISPDTVTGVAPHGRDRQLLVSLPAAIRLAMREYPQLQQVMNEKHGPLGELRVRQSMNENNVAAVELAAVQFEATTAASEAHRWLGDRALASGLFSRAIAEYDRALRTAPSSSKHDLLARKRLASAMLGLPEGTPATRPVAFGETLMSPGEFEAIVADMQRVNAASVDRAVPAPQQRVFAAPAPQGYEHVSHGNLDGPLGQDPNSEVTTDLNRLGINWCERQLATVVDGSTLYVSNRFQVAAYNLENGQKRWQTTDLPGNKLRSRDWSLIPMRPLVTGKHVYIRLLYGSGPVLACFEKDSGRLVWSGEQRQNEYLVSDPLLIQDELLGLTLVKVDQGQSILRLTTFAKDSGEPLLHRNLVHLSEVWWTRRACEVAPLDDAIVATLGGLSLCCDLSGEVRWIRKHVAMPSDPETSWVKQYFERPLQVGSRVLLSQPGVRSLDCIDAETGRLFWKQVIPDLESVVGVLDNRVIVRTEAAFIAFDVESGAKLWRHARPPVFDAALLGGEGGFVYVAREPMKDRGDRFFPRLVWLDPATGQPTASFAFTPLEDNEPHFGPLVRWQDRLFTFWGRGNAQPNREFLELRPKAELPVERSSVANSRDPWGQFVDPLLTSAVSKQFPEWSLLAAKRNGESGWHADKHGEKDVASLCAAERNPILLVRAISPSAGSQPKLRIRFDQRCDTAGCKVRAYLDGQLLAEQVVEQKTQGTWKDLELDLKQAAGKSGHLNLRVDLDGGGEMSTYWKRLEYVP
jgi:outer membrane protein assembly factor BamB/tetratricopeptide (TPR) repeat protein